LEAHAKLAKRRWLGATVDGTAAKNFINGEFRESKATTFYEVHDPVSNVWLRADSPLTPAGYPAGRHTGSADYTR
jgi:hypothetical protein